MLTHLIGCCVILFFITCTYLVINTVFFFGMCDTDDITKRVSASGADTDPYHTPAELLCIYFVSVFMYV